MKKIIWGVLFLTAFINAQRVKDYYMEVARGTYYKQSSVFKFGENLGVETSEEVIWDVGGAYSGFLTAATTVDASSDDAADTELGAGARKIFISGLDSNWLILGDTLYLTGLSKVTSTKKFLRINRIIVMSDGNGDVIGGSNIGTITIEKTGSPATVLAQILPNNGQTLMCVYTVPANKIGYLVRVNLGGGKSKELEFKLRTYGNSLNESSWGNRGVVVLYEDSMPFSFVFPQPISPKTDIVITGKNLTSGSVEASASFELMEETLN